MDAAGAAQAGVITTVALATATAKRRVGAGALRIASTLEIAVTMHAPNVAPVIMVVVLAAETRTAALEIVMLKHLVDAGAPRIALTSETVVPMHVPNVALVITAAVALGAVIPIVALETAPDKLLVDAGAPRIASTSEIAVPMHALNVAHAIMVAGTMVAASEEAIPTAALETVEDKPLADAGVMIHVQTSGIAVQMPVLSAAPATMVGEEAAAAVEASSAVVEAMTTAAQETAEVRLPEAVIAITPVSISEIAALTPALNVVLAEPALFRFSSESASRILKPI